MAVGVVSGGGAADDVIKVGGLETADGRGEVWQA